MSGSTVPVYLSHSPEKHTICHIFIGPFHSGACCRRNTNSLFGKHIRIWPVQHPPVAIVIQPRFHGASAVVDIHRTCKNDHVCAVNSFRQWLQLFIIWAKFLIFHNTLIAPNTKNVRNLLAERIPSLLRPAYLPAFFLYDR